MVAVRYVPPQARRYVSSRFSGRPEGSHAAAVEGAAICGVGVDEASERDW